MITLQTCSAEEWGITACRGLPTSRRLKGNTRTWQPSQGRLTGLGRARITPLCHKMAAPGEHGMSVRTWRGEVVVTAGQAQYPSPLRRPSHPLAACLATNPDMASTWQKALAKNTVATQTECLSKNTDVQVSGCR